MGRKRLSVALIDWQYFWVRELSKRFSSSTSDFISMCLQIWLSEAQRTELVSKEDLEKLLTQYHEEEKENAIKNMD